MTENHKSSIVEEDSPFIPSNLAITAMRDSGYKNTAYALAELIDNSQQAKASIIEIFCDEKDVLLQQRKRSRLARIAVLDNGEGMDVASLRKALQFGNGNRLNDRTGIGRFGMGLPNASISQAGHVDIWSWQNGPDNALHTYLDVKEIECGDLKFIPEPIHKAVPEDWRTISDDIGKTGTLIVWSDLDYHRLTWKTAKSTLENTELLVGRIYRRFICEGKLTIRLLAKNEKKETIFEQEAKVVDPLYIMPSLLVPEPFKNTPMFEEVFGDEQPIEYEGKTHKVSIKYSVAKQETVDASGASDRGNTKYGKHASRNMGISVVRAGRELILDNSWCISYDPRERWWGAEVEFPPALDEIFGVTNNKQAATHFSELASLEWEQLAEEGELFTDVKNRLREEGDPRGWLLELSDNIRRSLKQLRDVIKAQGKQRRSTRKTRHNEPDDVTSKVNDSWKQRSKDRPIEGEDVSPGDGVLDDFRTDLTDNKKYSKEEADQIVELVKEHALNVVFLEADFPDNLNLFNVEFKGNITEITFNRKHPAFDHIFGTVNTVDEDINDLSKEEILNRLIQAINSSKIIFAAWARYERESGLDRATALARVRTEWGQIAATFLESEKASSL